VTPFSSSDASEESTAYFGVPGHTRLTPPRVSVSAIQ
jgi:hypothetical protein